MVKDTIKAVKAAEKDATKLAKETSEKRQQMLADALQEVASQKKELELALANEREEALKKATLENEKVMEQMVEQTQQEVILLKNQAKEKQQEVCQLIIQQLT